MRPALRRSCLLVLASLTLGAQEGPPAHIREKEAALGAALAQDVRRRTTPLDSAAVRDYVERLGRQLASQLPDPGFAYTFTVVADGLTGRTHEPLALPGGYVFVPASLILAARDEAEFAGMLAHGVAHVAARHGIRTGDIPLVFIGGEEGTPVPVRLLESRRTFELEADRMAVQAMARAGYDPGALLRYIERVQVGRGTEQFSPLPSRETRIAKLEEAIRELPPGTHSSGGEFNTIQEEVRRLTPARARRVPSLRRPNDPR